MDPLQGLTEKLEKLREKRGYLLPHHGLLAITSPGLLDAYDAAYTALALDDRVLSRHDREFVWLAILIATEEALATHHVAKFREAGGTDAEISSILSLTALALGFKAFRFVEQHWLQHLPAMDARQIYLSAVRRSAGEVAPRLAHLAVAAVHTCSAAWDALRFQIVAAYQDAVPEEELAEALSLCMFPGSVPHFVEAARVWRELVNAGEVSASPAFRGWAALSGQGGYDEAAQAKDERR